MPPEEGGHLRVWRKAAPGRTALRAGPGRTLCRPYSRGPIGRSAVGAARDAATHAETGELIAHEIDQLEIAVGSDVFMRTRVCPTLRLLLERMCDMPSFSRRTVIGVG